MTPQTQNTSCICGKPDCIIPYGICHCGCGQKVRLATHTNTKGNRKRGMPTRWCFGHSRRIRDEYGDEKYRNHKRRMARLKAEQICPKCGKRERGRTVLCEPCRVQDRALRRERHIPKPRRPRMKGIKRTRKCRICKVVLPDDRAGFCEMHEKRQCEWCEQTFLMVANNHRLGKRFCSSSCRGKHQTTFRGESGHNWRGGVTPDNRAGRTGLEYRAWREAIFARDNWTCQKCFRRGGITIHAHHIKEFAKHPELRNELSNGLTLCKDCHYDIHRRKPKPCRTEKFKSRPAVATSEMSPTMQMPEPYGSHSCAIPSPTLTTQ